MPTVPTVEDLIIHFCEPGATEYANLLASMQLCPFAQCPREVTRALTTPFGHLKVVRRLDDGEVIVTIWLKANAQVNTCELLLRN